MGDGEFSDDGRALFKLVAKLKMKEKRRKEQLSHNVGPLFKKVSTVILITSTLSIFSMPK